jgi:hypothetical protein
MHDRTRAVQQAIPPPVTTVNNADDNPDMLPTSERQNFDLAKYIVSSTRYEYSIQYIVSYNTIHCF